MKVDEVYNVSWSGRPTGETTKDETLEFSLDGTRFAYDFSDPFNPFTPFGLHDVEEHLRNGAEHGMTVCIRGLEADDLTTLRCAATDGRPVLIGISSWSPTHRLYDAVLM